MVKPKKSKYSINGDRLLVESVKPKTKTDAGIELLGPPEEAERDMGKIIAVGVDCRDNRFKAGRDILFANQGFPVKIDGQEFVIIESEFVFVIFE